jgi:copper chaperone CopZ
MKTATIRVQGMADENDKQKVSRALLEVWGVRGVNVDLEKREAAFTYDELAAKYMDFQQAILDSGFEIYTQNGEVEEKKIN